MARLTAAKHTELETFWRAHLEGWRHSELNQREYCELHGLPLERFGSWRAKFKPEDDVPRQKLLWRRGGGLKHMSGHMLREISPAPRATFPRRDRAVRSGVVTSAELTRDASSKRHAGRVRRSREWLGSMASAPGSTGRSTGLAAARRVELGLHRRALA